MRFDWTLFLIPSGENDVTDHVSQSNHTIDWEKVKLPMKEAQWRIRGIKEAVAIRKAGPRTLNRDEGRHHLPDVYSSLLVAAPPSGKREH